MLFYLALLFAVVMSVCDTETTAWTDCGLQAVIDQGATTCDTQYDAMISCTCGIIPSCTSDCEAYYTCTVDNPVTQLTDCAELQTTYLECGTDGDFTPVGAGPCYDGSFNTIAECACDDSCALCGFNDSPTDADDCITCADVTIAVTAQYEDGTGTCGGDDGGNDDGSDDMCVEEVSAYGVCMATNSCTNELDLYIVCLMAEEGISTECTTQYTALFDCEMENEAVDGTCTNKEELEDAAEECMMMNSGDDCMVCMATNDGDSCPDESDVTAYCTCLCSNCFDDCTAVMTAACADSSQADCITFCEGDMAAGDGVDFDMCGCDDGVAPDACGVCGGTDTTCTTGAGTGDGADGDGAMGLLLSVVFFLQAFLW